MSVSPMMLVVALWGGDAPARWPELCRPAEPMPGLWMPVNVDDLLSFEDRFWYRYAGGSEAFLRSHIHHTQRWGCYSLTGESYIGFAGVWYLGGHGTIAAELGYGAGRPRLLVALNWYPYDGVQYGLGFDLVGWRPLCTMANSLAVRREPSPQELQQWIERVRKSQEVGPRQ